MKKIQVGLVAVGVSAALAASGLIGGCSSSNSTPSGTDGGSSSSSSSGGSGSSSGSSSSSSSGGSGSSSGSSSSSSSSGGGGDAGAFPAVPVLATTFIDRLGRPAVNTALTDTFDTNATTKGNAENGYNEDGNEDGWVATYTGPFSKILPIYDGLDTVCGNQLLAAKVPADAGTDAGVSARYAPLAGALAADHMLLDSRIGTCNQYLAVELGVAGDCGGRTPTMNVVDITYNAVAGTLALDAGISEGPLTNGITADDKQTTATFPFLAAPAP